MIINYPTGFYSSMLPSKPSDGGNVTYMVSNNRPPRTDLVFSKAPSGIVNRKRETVIRSRRSKGALVFSYTMSAKTFAGNNGRTYEIGQSIEFGDVQPPSIEPMLVGGSEYIRHDLNMYDYSQLGLTNDDVVTIKTLSENTLASLQARLNQLRTDRFNAEEITKVQQKIINDINRNIEALNVMSNIVDVNDIVVKLTTKLNQAIAARQAAIIAADIAASQAVDVSNQISVVSSVVK